jgi:hypothetical protein
MITSRTFWILIVAASLLLPSTSFAGKKKLKALDDEEMEEITAAGDPTIAIAEGDGAIVNYTDESIFSLAFPEGAQKGLRALTVQNVVGEVQLLVNLNVAAVQGDIAGTDQRNFSVQSWGSTAPLLSDKVDGFGPVAEAARGGDVQDNEIDQHVTLDPGTAHCSTDGGQSSCSVSNTPQIQTAHAVVGGNAAATSQPGVSGIVEIGIGSADVIVSARCPGDDPSKCHGNTANVSVDPTFSLAMEKGGQENLGALFIANIVGRAQTAFNINIAAAQLHLFPTADSTLPFADPAGSSSAVIKQVNSGVQFRGTPLGVGNTSATVNVTHTPN